MEERKKHTLTLKNACRERIKELVKHCRKIKQKQKEATKELNKQEILEQCVENCGFCRHLLKRTNENKGKQ